MHATDERNNIIVIALGKPRCNAAQVRKHKVGLPCSVFILDMIEQSRDVAALDADEITINPVRIRVNVLFQTAPDLVGAAQLLLGDMPLEPFFGDGLEAVWLNRDRLDGWLTSLDALDGRRDRARAASMLSTSALPRLVQICLPNGSRVTLAYDFAPDGCTLTSKPRHSGSGKL